MRIMDQLGHVKFTSNYIEVAKTLKFSKNEPRSFSLCKISALLSTVEEQTRTLRQITMVRPIASGTQSSFAESPNVFPYSIPQL